MRTRNLIWMGALGIAALGCFVFFASRKNDPFAERRQELAEELKEMKSRFDKPAEAAAYHVNRRTGGWVRTGERGSSPTAIGRPLDPNLYLAAIEQARGMARYSTATNSILPAGRDPLYNMNAPAGGTLGTWSPLGPSNQGGRTRQLLIQPNNPNIMYAAAVGGGVWKTTDGGANWAAMTDLAIPNIAVSSLAFDPSNYNRIYAGTGEGFFNGDAIRGAGIFVSSDAGNSWNQLASTNGQDFHYVNDLVVSPRNPQRIYAATRTGVFRSNNSGATWSLLGTGPNGCSDLAMQMNRSIAYVYATCGFFTQIGDVKRALDSSTSTLSSVFTTTNMSRATLAIAPSNENIIYVLASNGGSGTYNDAVLGVYRSTAGGAPGSWTARMTNNGVATDPVPLNNLLLTNPVYAYNTCVGAGARGFYNQGWYDQTIAVDPVDSERVWVGGIDLFRSDDGGQNFGIASYWWKGQGTSNYSHADHHVIAFHPGYNGTSNRIMFNANDGGIFRTNDARAALGTTVANVCGTSVSGAVTWTELNNNYTTMQFYQGSPYADGDSYFGGTQDNGTWRGSIGSSIWQNLLGGDGGYTAVDTRPSAADNVLFAAFTNLSIQKSTNNGVTFFDAINGISGDGGFAFISPLHMNPGNRQHLWAGGFYIWRTINQATSWTRASGITPGLGSVSAIASSEADTNKVVFGMDDGYIGFNTAALTATTTAFWQFTRPRIETVTSLAYDPLNSNTVWATYGTFSGPSVYRSTNSGATWTAVPGTGANTLPAVPALTVVVDPTDSNRVYVGTDIGVFTTIDGGANWYKEVTGFANVSVEWLAINTTGTRRLYAFTHGRGAWRVNLIP